MNPDAVMDDGLFDMALVPHKTYSQVMVLLVKVFRGTHRHDPTINLTVAFNLKSPAHIRCLCIWMAKW